MTEFSRATPRERKNYLMQRLTDLKQERAPWVTRWQEVSRYISPFNGRFEVNDHLESRNYDAILDNIAGTSLDILVSGLASGATSPVRQWFKVGIPDTALMRDITVAGWCTDVEHILLQTFQTSNTYNSLHSLYRELCLFGVGVDLIYDDDETIIRHHVLSAGEYCLQTNNKGVVDTLYREFQLTVSQAIQEFGWDNMPKSVQYMYNAGDLDRRLDFCHAIEPRHDRVANAKDNKNMPWASYYFMVTDESDNREIISESGFKRFPALCPRWDVIAGETYGLSPAMTALPNVKQLQQESEVKSNVLELLVNPPIQAPANMRQEAVSLMPNAINFTGSTGVDQTIKPILAGVGDINALSQDIEALKQEIRSNFYVDLFLMVQNSQDDRKTAAEIYALKEEKMLVLGAVVERLQHELLKPLVAIAFDRLMEEGFVPNPPQQAMGSGLELEFQSMLAQSQRAIDINSIERMLSSIQAFSASMPDILDRLDPDGIVDTYRDRLAVDPVMIRSKEDAEAIRQQRQQAAAQQAQSEQANLEAGSVNQLMQAQKAGASASLATQQLEQIGGEGGLY